MDIATLTNSVTGYLVPVLPFLLKAGEKAAEEAGGKIAGEAWDAIKALWAGLRPRVEAKPAALEAAQDVALAPDDADAQIVLRRQLTKLLTEDQAWAAEIENLVAQVKSIGGSRVSADRGGVAFGDHARDNIVITGGIGGDFVKGDKITQGDRSVIVKGDNSGSITTGDTITEDKKS